MNLRLLAFLICSFALFATSCSDDEADPTFDNVSVTAPSDVLNLESGAAGQSITFNVSYDAGLTATYTATGNNVTIQNTSGNVDGNTVTINFDAGTTVGAGSITLSVTDSEGNSDEDTAVLNIADELTEITIAGNITSDQTWETGKTYILAGRIAVEDGATLTIEPGTVVKGKAGTGANATALLVARGGTLMADGTATAPIIFTTVADDITPADIANGNFQSPNLDPTQNGFWGGLIILGKAPISASNDNGDITEVQIEGIPTSDPNGLYGGNDPNDNSGVIRYISVRHGGTNIGAGNEINGITLGGVGNGTVIENVEVVANQDDGIEWFGGTVNVTNAVVWNAGDDAIDTDQAWSGTLDNFVVVTPGDASFELDGPEGSATGTHTIQFGSVIASTDDSASNEAIDLDDDSMVNLKNIFITGLNEGQQITSDDAPGVTFDNVFLDIPAADFANYIESGNANISGVSAGGTSQVNKSVLGWTWAAQAGGLDSL